MSSQGHSMARIRTIKPEFFRHEELFEAERNTSLPLRIAFAGLWTIADREGRFRWRPRVIKLDVMPFDDVDFEAVLSALADYGFIAKYQVGDEIFAHIPKWEKHQHVNQRESASDIPAPTSNGASMCVHSPARGEGKGREQEGKGNGKGRGNGAQARATLIRKNDLAEQFERFRKAYPKRKGSNPWEPARQKFERAVRDGARPDGIISGCERYAAQERELGHVGTEFVMQAVTWLNRKCWQDYSEEPSEARAEAVFIPQEDYRWTSLCDRHEQEFGKRPKAMNIGGSGVPGYHFRKAWVDEDMTVPPQLRRGDLVSEKAT